MKRAALLAVLLFIAIPQAILAQGGALARPLTGLVEYRQPDSPFQTLTAATRLPAGAEVRSGVDGTASLLYPDSTEVLVRPGTTVRIRGEEGGIISVLLGRILVRARRLLRSEADTEIRTPTAVAAIRGTELTVDVDRATVTEVFVREGLVAVSNVVLPDQEVLVAAGEMTRVEPFLPPTPARPFQQEGGGPGELDALELGEDPALEAAQEPATARWAAFPVLALDVDRSPAFIAPVDAPRSSTVLWGGGYAATEQATADGSTGEARWEGHDLYIRSVTAVPVGSATLGVVAEGRDARDRTPLLPPAPGADAPRAITRSRVGAVRALGGFRLAGGGLGVGVGVRRSDTRADTTGAETHVTGDILSAEVGWLQPLGRGELAVGIVHQALASSTTAGPVDVDMTGRNQVLRLVYRTGGRTIRWGGVLEGHWTEQGEDRLVNGSAWYHEDLSVRSLRAGPSIGLMPTPDLLLGADMVAGISSEKATQLLPDGTLREDEKDVRWFAGLHVGSHLQVARHWLLSMDLTHMAERTTKDFTFPAGSPTLSSGTTGWTQRTRAMVGGGFTARSAAIEYLISSPYFDGGPLVHSLAVIWTP
jgi:hypothetical protein